MNMPIKLDIKIRGQGGGSVYAPIPKPLASNMDIKPGDEFEISVRGLEIILKRKGPGK